MRAWDRQRVLALVWLVGAGLTFLTLVLPYDIDLATGRRTVVAGLALLCAAVLWRGPQLPVAGLHLVVAAGSVLIAYCTSLGVPDIEGVMFLLPIVYASATFRAREALGHVVLAVALFGLVLVGADEAMTVAPWIAFTCVAGVGAVLCFVLVTIVEVRERERLAGERDRRIAGELQRTLLPDRLPTVDGALLAARYLPAAREADVGGDLY
ncbi:MAG TPA: hypothetical protein VD931_16955, partial [Baekduia sp.]|nr:hypothetical protein [Baekduia sp.]